MRDRTPRKSTTRIPARERRHGYYEPSIRKLYLPQLALGLIFTASCFCIGYYFGGFILTMESHGLDLNFRISYALRCSFPMLLTLFVGILMTSIKRRLSDAVNPLSGHENLVQIEKNYLTNTVEQLILGFTLMLIIATYAETAEVLRLLSVYSYLFTIGRLLFRVGYRKTNHCAYREVGMSMNLGATFVMIAIVAYYFCVKGIRGGLSFY